jgi:hypothetical protein
MLNGALWCQHRRYQTELFGFKRSSLVSYRDLLWYLVPRPGIKLLTIKTCSMETELFESQWSALVSRPGIK